MSEQENSAADFTTLRKHWDECSAKEIDHRTDVERALLADMFKFYDALRHLGWQDAIYCPKDGSVFLAIEAGSTGVFECSYDGEWPKGTWWIHSAGDMWPSRPILWKPIPKKATP